VPLPPLKPDLGEWFNRLRDCLDDLLKLKAAVDALPTSSNPQAQLQAIKAALIDWIEHHSIYNCTLYQQVIQVEIVQNPDGGGGVPAAQLILDRIILELFRECVCSTLLPPCPLPADDNCVPIATLTLNCKGGCNVVRICNLEHRRIVITFPILQYFLGGIFKAANFSQILTRLCCSESRFTRGDVILAPAVAAAEIDPIDQIFNDAVKAGGVINRRQVLQRLAALVQDIPSRVLNQPGGSHGNQPK
jgi:hypothetical protein